MGSGWRGARAEQCVYLIFHTRRYASRALHVYQDEDGMVVVRGRLAPEVGAVLVQALAAARDALYQQTRGADEADALALVAQTALHHGIDPGAPGERFQVVVHVDAAALADPDQPANPSSRTARAFPRRRPGAWRATQVGW
jgi:hypothetical protein